MPEGSTVITNADDPVLEELDLPRERLTYGTEPSSDWWLTGYEPRAGGGARLEMSRPDGSPWRIESALTGRHNAMNALAAIAAATELGVAEVDLTAALARFRGTRRRFETRARRHDIWVVDDYAHHPTAVRATLRAAREAHDGRVVAVFQPHTTHRTAALLDEFAAAFGDADRAILAPIYRPTGREADEQSVTSSDLAARMQHPNASAVDSLDAAFDVVVHEDLRPGTLVLTLGAGDVTTLADRLAAHLGAGDGRADAAPVHSAEAG
jgi:UDP-N-acetylmuramate--alanine ligase